MEMFWEGAGVALIFLGIFGGLGLMAYLAGKGSQSMPPKPKEKRRPF